MKHRDEELLALVLDPAEETPAVGLDAAGRIVRWTAGAVKSLGYDAAGTLAKHVSELYTPEDVARGRPEADLREAAERGYTTRDGWTRRADGSRFWARTVIRSRRDPDGAVTGFIKLTLDLSDQLEVMRGLSAADQRFAGLIELSVDGIVSTDEDGIVILFNRGAERMFGYERFEVIGQPLRMLLAEHHRDAHDRHMRAFRAGRADAGRMAAGRVVTALAKDGTEFPIEASISRLELERGAVLSVILRDASERLSVERDLRDRAARARQLADALPFPIHYLDPELRHVFDNAAVGAWLGRGVDELPGLSLADAAAEVGSSATYELLRPHLEAALRGEAGHVTGRARDTGGAIHEVEILVVPSRDPAGTVDGCYVVTFDRTDGQRAEAARRILAVAGSLLGAAVETDVAIDSVARLAVGGFADGCVGYLSADEGALLCFDGSGPAGPGRRIERDDAPPGVRQVLADGQTRSYTRVEDRATYVVVPVPCTERAGGALLFRWAAPFDVGRSEVEVAQELGRRLAAAADRGELARRASEAVRTRDWLLRKVTHDLGNPVAAIVMAADRLLRTAPDPDRRQRSRVLLEGVTQQAQEMRLIIEELLDLSVLRTGTTSIVQRAVDVAALMRKALSLVEPVAIGRGVAVELPPPPDARVIADPVQLRHALVAFLSDAVGRSDEGASVRFAASRQAGQVSFEVVGPGLGVPGEEVTSRLEAMVPPLREGGDAIYVSLALLIGSEIVRGHGGRVVVDDGPGGETIVRFALPTA